MRVVSISVNDYANFMHENAKALRSIGVDCVDLIQSRHIFNYKTQGQLASQQQMIQQIKSADIVQVNDSHPELFKLAKTYCKGKIVVYHIGTRYREKHEELNKLFEGHTTITDQCEFMVLGDHKYLVSPVEMEFSGVAKEKPYKIAHYPSNPEVKGTAKIIELIKKVSSRYDFKLSLKTVSHDQQIDRMRGCDIYVELFKPEINGKQYGCFGVTALEAAAMGKIVVTNNLFPDVYKDVYGVCPLTIINTEDNFVSYFNQLLKMDVNFIADIQKQNYELMRENHSYEATGNRILKLIS